MGFSLFKPRAEAVQVTTPAETLAETLQRAVNRVNCAEKTLGDLRDEYRAMAMRHELRIVGIGLLHIGRTESLDESATQSVYRWYRNWQGRMNSAVVEFNDSLSVWAGLKEPN